MSKVAKNTDSARQSHSSLEDEVNNMSVYNNPTPPSSQFTAYTSPIPTTPTSSSSLNTLTQSYIIEGPNGRVLHQSAMLDAKLLESVV
ncbi:hypothetical protein HMI54_012873 [Coelomomyces lativittatus]|nr:hypothetical protein HMI56_005303 [Coelomomyces lativittatus]KAJ1498213.1 hypothetical protein HMI54_012873 [Coelomomyces lativittatus]KAJ1498219.1 hypothetical protein HMI55_005056 [Coelomomyces lativittatus]